MVGMGFVKNWTQLLALRAVLGIFVRRSQATRLYCPAADPRVLAQEAGLCGHSCPSAEAYELIFALHSFPACLFLITCVYESSYSPSLSLTGIYRLVHALRDPAPPRCVLRIQSLVRTKIVQNYCTVADATCSGSLDSRTSCMYHELVRYTTVADAARSGDTESRCSRADTDSTDGDVSASSRSHGCRG